MQLWPAVTLACHAVDLWGDRGQQALATLASAGTGSLDSLDKGNTWYWEQCWHLWLVWSMSYFLLFNCLSLLLMTIDDDSGGWPTQAVIILQGCCTRFSPALLIPMNRRSHAKAQFYLVSCLNHLESCWNRIGQNWIEWNMIERYWNARKSKSWVLYQAQLAGFLGGGSAAASWENRCNQLSLWIWFRNI